ncbi:3-oxoacyl-ACP synthase [Cephaloticoccus primus]|uniref:3-oxoacyl-ACP synthase n=1 Tax=Cephaloticoccus primus TaxID=1548207 RepID=A0A139SMK3_9BACT|nr:3-oxoacyl-ACP synthase III [Cephaloticoccus primus]KXU35826.1 3-oxoacyl-ACP synthase [Cephaloticoccus primus]
MKFSCTCIESLEVVLPEEVLSSADIEQRLRPLYERLRLPEGRLELMTGIRERRLWPAGKRPSDASARAGRAALARSAIRPEQVELYIHGAVCRDMLEPATASFAHRKIGLSPRCQLFDLSNACLGFLNALTVAASMIESGQIRAALITCGEDSRPLVEQTLRTLNAEPLTRNGIKPYFANLTIGSGAVGAVLCHESLVGAGRPAHRLLGGVARAATVHSELCQGDTHGADSLAMQTDSEALLVAGVNLAAETWAEFCEMTGWTATTPDRFISHQVGSVHRRKIYETLGLDLAKDFSTLERLGNTGSVALPATLGLAVQEGAIDHGDKVALLGIGSGLNSLMLALEW